MNIIKYINDEKTFKKYSINTRKHLEGLVNKNREEWESIELEFAYIYE